MKISAILLIVCACALATEPCTQLTTQLTCDANSTCTWCRSAAVGSQCYTIADAKTLPPAVFACDNITLASSSDVVLESFAKGGATHKWVENNDPVMGGKSTGTTTVTQDALIFDGKVVDVPSLHAPGFITTQTDDKNAWADVSGCKSLSMTLKTNTNYTGYRVSFGRARALVCKKFFAYGYKSHFDAPPVGTVGTVTIPFTDFSDCWDDGTGKIITTCAKDPRFCPTDTVLKDLKTISIWGEGVGGDVHLEVYSISGTECN